MSHMIVEARHVSKEFTLLHNRGSLKQKVLGLFNSRQKPWKERLMAVHDVSFRLEKGSSLALIGPNGSGKSTLLQLISGILLPTSGHIQVTGTVAPLIELGVGFHPELTGAENIYLNASLFGMSNQQTRQQFDAIIDFSGLEKFMDIPVKNYSSGMFMRLGFSVAVHVKPQLLLADEILAVGDAEFQQKCLDRITEMKRQGMALILVTHSMQQAQIFCDRYLQLEKGRIISQGTLSQKK